MNRKLINGIINYDGATPSKTDIKTKIASQLKAKTEDIVVDNVKVVFGTNSAKFEARIYDDEDSLKKIELKYIFKKNNAEKKEENKTETKEVKEEVAQVKKEEPVEEKKEEN